MFQSIRIGTKILVIMLATSLSALLIISAISYNEILHLSEHSRNTSIKLGETSSKESQEALLKQAEEYLVKIATEKAENVNSALVRIQEEILVTRDYIEYLYTNPQNFIGRDLPLPDETAEGILSSKYMLAPDVVMNSTLQKEIKLISNAEYILDPIIRSNSIYFNIYLGTKDGISYRHSTSNAYNKAYDPRTRDWFSAAMAKNRDPVWLDTYFDPFGYTVVSVAAAYNDANGNLHGVIATDLILESIERDILNTKIGKEGYAFLLDNQANYIAHPLYKTKNFEKKSLKTANETQTIALQEMAKGETGFSIVELNNAQYYIAYAPLPAVDWSLGIVLPISEVTLPAQEIKGTIEGYTVVAQNFIHKTLSDILIQFIVLFALCILALICVSFFFARSITNPIKDLVKNVQYIGEGNLDSAIEVKGSDEIGQLATSFNTMAINLKDYIANLSIAIKEKETINSELNFAASIQEDMLPRISPKFSKLENVQVFAKMTPAKEVGGDFYDIFFIDEEKTKLCCIVADVSGKGVPASLYMVITKTILKSTISSGLKLVGAVTQSNNLLAEDNNACMFVTAFVTLLDTTTGRFEYVNCGHNPPLLYRKGGAFEFMDITPSLPLAAMEDSPYEQEEIFLQSGDIVYLYTDGVNEAMNEQDEFYGNDALVNVLNAIQDKENQTSEAIDTIIRQDVDSFVGNAVQADDITTLVLKYTKENSYV